MCACVPGRFRRDVCGLRRVRRARNVSVAIVVGGGGGGGAVAVVVVVVVVVARVGGGCVGVGVIL